MLAYLLPGANPMRWQEHPAAGRLVVAGPWQAQPHQDGALIAWRDAQARPVRLGDLKAGVPTADGLTYYGPSALPIPDALRHFSAKQRAVEPVEIRPGLVLRVRPAMASPRQMLSSGEIGDFVGSYPIRTRHLMTRLNAKEVGPEIDRELFAVVRMGLEQEYRLTDELLDDLGWIDEESIIALWEGILGLGKTFGGIAAAS
jgi:hypothetical protein